jgi:hypothetical protein
VTPGEGLAADGVDSSIITVVVRDASNQPMAGVEVQIAASGAGNTVTQPPAVTNPLGIASGSMVTSTAGAKSLTVTLDPDGHAVVCNAHPIVRFGPRATVAGVARVADTDGNGTLDQGDTITVKFSAAVSCGSTSAAAFTLPVTGDTLGTGATMADGINADEVVITLGNNPSLRTRQSFDSGATAAGFPSGLDISGSIVAGAIVDDVSGQTVEASTPVDLLPFFAVVASGLGAHQSAQLKAGDFDADGDLDLVAIDEGGTVEVFENNGSGGFTDTGIDLGIGSQCAIRDFDGDGLLDVAVAGNSAGALWMNDGFGGFTLDVEVFGGAGTTALAAADLDSDGDVDLLEGKLFGSDEVWLNDGTGAFTSAGTFGSGSLDVTPCDLDGDGDMDWLTAGLQAGVQTWFNDGVTWNQGAAIGTAAVRAFDVYDYDYDGDLDVAISVLTNGIEVWDNDGAGNFAPSGIELPETNTNALWFDDHDSDGDADLLCGTTTGLAVFEGDGIGAMSTDRLHSFGNQISTMVVADFDRDGDLDVLGGSAIDTDEVHEGALIGSYGPVTWTQTAQELGASDTTGLALGDFDGDLKLDFVESATGVGCVVWLGLGDGDFTQGDTFGSLAITAVVAGDLDGDGDQDLVAACEASDSTEVWLNDGDGTFTLGSTLAQLDYSAAALGDLDGDGDLDLVLGVDGAGNRVLTNDGAGSFTDTAQSLGADATTAVLLGDMDGDGDLDLVELASDDDCTLWTNDGAGTFTLAQSIAAGVSTCGMLCDVDADYDLDVVIGDSSSGGMVLVNDGAGTLTDSGQTIGAAGVQALALADVDHDGDLDVLAAVDTPEVELWSNDGSGTFTAASAFGGLSARALLTEDLEDDGDPDVIVGNDGVEGVTVHLHD